MHGPPGQHRIVNDAPALLEVGGRVSALFTSQRTVWRPQYTRNALVLAILHGSECDVCSAYARALGDARDSFRAWDGQLVLALPDPADHADAAGGTSVVTDRFGGAPRVVVADRFGHIFHVEDAGHRLPEPRSLEEWLRFLATQCPE